MSHSDIIAFIKSSFPSQEFIPLHEPKFIGREKEYVLDAIDSTFVSSVGRFVDEFEWQLAEFTGMAKAVSVVNGTAALQVALRLAGVRKDDEVITQALTFVATTNAIAYNGARPVFVDVDLDTMGMSPRSLENFFNEFGELRGERCYNKLTGKKIAACMPMHTFGFMCRIDRIVEICKAWNVPVVEDAAEGLGSAYKGQSAGSFGLLSAFSFNGNKIITSGGGGAIVTNNENLGLKAKYLTTTAKKPHPWAYEHDELGYNFRMPNLNAALAKAQLEQFELLRSSKRILFEEYKAEFDSRGVDLKQIPEDTDWNYWLMSLQLEDKEERDLFLKETNKSGIMTRPIWNLIYKLPMYSGCQRDQQKNAEYLEDRIVNIPSSARL